MKRHWRLQIHNLTDGIGRAGNSECLKRGLLWVILGLGYYMLICLTGYSLDCPFRELTGYLCPGCGTTRMVLLLGRGRLREAFFCNPVVFCTLPGAAVFYLAKAVEQARGRAHSFAGYEKWIQKGYLLLLVLYGILRNGRFAG